MRPLIRDARALLFHGDALDIASVLPPNSIDALIEDPPYGLGFMGKAWDHEVPGVPFWEAAMRVMKPGAHGLVFGGTRKYHRQVCAIEDAGFEIRDCLMWLYGCLTPDVEVLTPAGWVRGIDVREGDSVAQWDPASGAITAAAVERTYRAPWNGPMVRFRNSDTDQLLTPNHRVYHRAIVRAGGERGAWGEYRAREAGEISRRTPVRLPLAGEHNGPGVGGDDYAALLGWVWSEGGFDATGSGVRIYQSSVNGDKVAEIDALLDRLGAHRRYSYGRTYESRRNGPTTYQAVTWYFSGDLAERVRADLPEKHPTYTLLWRMSLTEKRAFLRAALLGDGSCSQGSWTFEQKDATDREWFVTLLALVGWRGKDYTRTARDGGSVSVTQRADTTMTPAAMQAASNEPYAGDVWCIGVSTGAFVARRNGQVFVTGNSGFPKSLNVSKAIDAHLGTEPLVLGTRAGTGTTSFGGDENGKGLGAEVPITLAGSPEAAAWDGWGTALKPAWEPIILFRKPLEGTVAENVLRYGTGGLNIDACRIASGARPLREHTGRDGKVYGAGLEGSRAVGDTEQGRWPANLILDELAALVLDEQSGTLKSGSMRAGTPRGDNAVFGKLGGTNATEHDIVGSKGGASRFFYTAKAARKEKERGLDHLPARSGGEATDREDGSKGLENPRAGAGRTGGARNVHPTVKPVSLMRYLVRLITPPGGVVLDRFGGSGTTAVAALEEGLSVITVEQGGPGGEYLPIIEGRIRAALARTAGNTRAPEDV